MSTSVPPDPLAASLLRIKADHASILAELRRLATNDGSAGRSGSKAEGEVAATTRASLIANREAAIAELAEAEPQTYQDCIAKLEYLIDPYIGWNLDQPVQTALTQVVAFLRTQHGGETRCPLEGIADELALELARSSDGNVRTDEEEAVLRARIDHLSAEIMRTMPSSLSDVLVKLRHLRDHAENARFSAGKEQMLAGMVEFLERLGAGTPPEKGDGA